MSEDDSMKVFLCYVCGRRYRTQEQLERHLAGGHPDSKVREKPAIKEHRIQEKSAFTEKAKRITTKYQGRCVVCNEKIDIGEEAIYESGIGIAHTSCVGEVGNDGLP